MTPAREPDEALREEIAALRQRVAELTLPHKKGLAQRVGKPLLPT